MTTATLNPRSVAKALTPHVESLLKAKAIAEVERARVDKIQRQVLQEDVYMVDESHLRDGKEPYRITEPKKDWLIDEQQAEKYYQRLNEIHLANGFEKAADGYCPALCAESVQRKAEHDLLEAAQEFFPGFTVDNLLAARRDESGESAYKKAVDMLIELVVNAPGYVAPKIG